MVVSKAHLAVAVARPNSMGKKISGNSCGRTDRILRGQKPAELPVQTPTKYETRSQPPSPLSRIGSASLPYILPPLLQIYRSLAVKFSSKLLKPIHRTHPWAEAEKTSAGGCANQRSVNSLDDGYVEFDR